MQDKLKYTLNNLVNALPRSVNATKDLIKLGVPERTFYRDKAIKANSTQNISGDRLLIYAQYFNVSIEQLFTPAKKSVKRNTLKSPLA